MTTNSTDTTESSNTTEPSNTPNTPETGPTGESAETPEIPPEEAADHLEDIGDGCGCVEIWEHLSERREAED